MSRAAEVYEAVASALAAAHEPDLGAFDAAEVRAAMAQALATPAARAQLLALLQDRVKTLSGGRVDVSLRPDEDDPLTLPLRLVVAGEPFAEPVVLRGGTDAPVEFPMRGH